MTIIVMEAAPKSVRGEMKRWFLELKPGVFVGSVNARIRELLWCRICENKLENGAILVYNAPNEQGFEIKLTGSPTREVADFEGVQLIKKMSTERDCSLKAIDSNSV